MSFSRREEPLELAYNTLVAPDAASGTIDVLTNGLLTYGDGLLTVSGPATLRDEEGRQVATSIGTTQRPVGLATDGLYLFLALPNELWRMTVLTAAANRVGGYDFPSDDPGPARAIAYGDRILYLVTDLALYSVNPLTGAVTRVGELAHGVSGIKDMMWMDPHLYVVTDAAGGDRSIHIINRHNGGSRHVIRLDNDYVRATGIEWDGTRIVLAVQGASRTAIYRLLPDAIDLNEELYVPPDDFLRIWGWPDAMDKTPPFQVDGDGIRLKLGGGRICRSNASSLAIAARYCPTSPRSGCTKPTADSTNC